MDQHKELLLQNKAWALGVVQDDPHFFDRLLNTQHPKYLWIGCADSRVPPDKITGTKPGEIFIHRNIANMIVDTDLNMLSVLEYAVNVLEVEHVIVCGHYGCGGVKAAMNNVNVGLTNKWLINIKDVYRLHREELNAIADEKLRLRLLIELNIKEQLFNLTKTSIIQKAWQNKKGPMLHGWVYDLKDGIINELAEMSPDDPIDPIYRFPAL
jgi:carbonic anhydrase